ncbi:unnamed protein product, partial [Closterium sp. NIES-54]
DSPVSYLPHLAILNVQTGYGKTYTMGVALHSTAARSTRNASQSMSSAALSFRTLPSLVDVQTGSGKTYTMGTALQSTAAAAETDTNVVTDCLNSSESTIGSPNKINGSSSSPSKTVGGSGGSSSSSSNERRDGRSTTSGSTVGAVSPASVEKEGGVARRVVNSLFQRVEDLAHCSRFQIRVSLIEIHKDDIHDLLEFLAAPFPTSSPSSASPATVAALAAAAAAARASPSGPAPLGLAPPPRQTVAIRELPGGVSLTGVTEQVVTTRDEAIACLEHGLLFRATGSHNLNQRS